MLDLAPGRRLDGYAAGAAHIEGPDQPALTRLGGRTGRLIAEVPVTCHRIAEARIGGYVPVNAKLVGDAAHPVPTLVAIDI